jgi:hypothetical protein
MKIIRKNKLLLLLIAFIWLVSACQKKSPSSLKVFVRSSSNELIEGAQVVIVGDPSSKSPTHFYVDTLYTNASGYANFDMDSYFSGSSAKNAIGYFDIYAKSNSVTAVGNVRCRNQMTTVETIFLMN